MAEWVDAIDVRDVPPDTVVAVPIAGRWYAVCNDAGTFVVVDHRCPHAGGPLGRGRVAHGCIVCPVHHWPWDLRTGLTDERRPHMRLTFFRSEVRDGRLFVDVSGPVPPASQETDESPP